MLTTVDAPERTLTIERHIPAPPETLWAAWTDPERLPLWWGPRGFTCRTKQIDIREGGEWRFDMIGPDGTVYPNRHRFTLLDRPSRIEYLLDDDGKGDHHFSATVTFTPRDGGTNVALSMTFETAAERAEVENFGAVELGYTSLDCLAEAALGDTALSLTRIIAAPRATVWKAWTDPKALAQWYYPKDVSMAESDFDVREGGRYRCRFVGLQSGKSFPFSGTYRAIEPQHRLVYTHGWEDENGRIETETEVSVTFADTPRGTRVTFVQSGLSSAPVRDDHREGWGQALDRLVEYEA